MSLTRLFGKPRLYTILFMILLHLSSIVLYSSAQDTTATPDTGETPSEVPSRIDVQPEARDEEIKNRLENIFDATGWFIDLEVAVQDGVVFINGATQTDEFKAWAGNLARNTQDVAAVVNQIEVIEPNLLDFQPMMDGFRNL